jgi:hypothetical protein
MKFLTPTLHGLGDYAAAAVLIVAPFILSINEQSLVAYWASIAGGIGLIIYSLLTDYTFSVAKVIPFKTHLVLDSLAGLALIALALLLELDTVVRIYLIAMGAGVLLVVAVTQTEGASNNA